MSKENQNEALIKIEVNIVENNVIPISIKNPINKSEMNFISSEASINILGNKAEEKKIEEIQKEKEVKKIKEEKEEDENENEMKSILKEKMKELEDKLVEELYINLQNEITKIK